MEDYITLSRSLQKQNLGNQAAFGAMTGKYTGAPGANFYQMANHLSNPPVTMLEPCVKNAFCKNTPGTYECECKDGYHGDHYSWCALSRCPPGMWGAGEWCQPIPEHGRCLTDECIDFDCPHGFKKVLQGGGITQGDLLDHTKRGFVYDCEGIGSETITTSRRVRNLISSDARDPFKTLMNVMLGHQL